LIKTAESQLEDSYIYSLYQAGQEWIENNKVKTRITSDEAPIGMVTTTTTPVCKYFLMGRCKFNEKCHNRHPASHTNAGSKGTDQPLPPCQGNLKDHSSDVQENENMKKPQMRTATDVISRIQWDPELLETDFVIGYSDRFLGIIEEFAEFCWEDISTVGQDILAIPKHRIQYFKYKNNIVWDRRVQLDNFFGSRGEGTTIHDLVRKHAEVTSS